MQPDEIKYELEIKACVTLYQSGIYSYSSFQEELKDILRRLDRASLRYDKDKFAFTVIKCIPVELITDDLYDYLVVNFPALYALKDRSELTDEHLCKLLRWNYNIIVVMDDKDKTSEMGLIVLKQDPTMLHYIPSEIRTEEMYDILVETNQDYYINYFPLSYVKKHLNELVLRYSSSPNKEVVIYLTEFAKLEVGDGSIMGEKAYRDFLAKFGPRSSNGESYAYHLHYLPGSWKGLK